MAQGARKLNLNHPEIEKEIEWHRQNGSNILIPTSKIETNEFFRPIIDKVWLSVDQGDAYERKDSKNKVKYALSFQGLNRLGIGAGLRWNPRNSYRVDDGNDKLYVAFQATGGVTGPDGSLIENTQQYDLDLEIIKEEIEEQHRHRCKNWRDKSKQEKDDYVEYATNRDWRQKRRHKLTLAESGAKARVVRYLFGLKGLFTAEELKKPFIVVRYISQLPPAAVAHVKQLEAAAEQDTQKIYGLPSQQEKDAGTPISPSSPGSPEDESGASVTDTAAEPPPSQTAQASAPDTPPDMPSDSAEPEATPPVKALDESQWKEATKAEQVAAIRQAAKDVSYDLKAFESRAGASLDNLDAVKLAKLYHNLLTMVGQ